MGGRPVTGRTVAATTTAAGGGGSRLATRGPRPADRRAVGHAPAVSRAAARLPGCPAARLPRWPVGSVRVGVRTGGPAPPRVGHRAQAIARR
ncbi:hypothetical protein ACFUCQ_30755 [Streptomyces sp. NPDC057197]|uniref:hypothetical protein n=1 Tax=unclassified Streptomyces TaxID=2593676 RepID=UPI001331908A|nr:hypothetical protein [Streptomyces sp. SAT1]